MTLHYIVIHCEMSYHIISYHSIAVIMQTPIRTSSRATKLGTLAPSLWARLLTAQLVLVFVVFGVVCCGKAEVWLCGGFPYVVFACSYQT